MACSGEIFVTVYHGTPREGLDGVEFHSPDQLYVQLLETRTTTPGAGPSHLGPARDTPMALDPVHVAPPLEQTGEEFESNGEDAGGTDEVVLGRARMSTSWRHQSGARVTTAISMVASSYESDTGKMKKGSLRNKKRRIWSILDRAPTPRRGAQRLGVLSHTQSQATHA
ncbi:hypothetical protein PIB30_066609 [Stylosanthes scabra]|uniref:Uncharacterized protein n=1 Tax=Stylosanthes scabra TaxID=79078 RepID=A0ABU6QN55_9FABA|nr:hypothetical protein [Stylosanthes scabra]